MCLSLFTRRKYLSGRTGCLVIGNARNDSPETAPSELGGLLQFVFEHARIKGDHFRYTYKKQNKNKRFLIKWQILDFSCGDYLYGSSQIVDHFRDTYRKNNNNIKTKVTKTTTTTTKGGGGVLHVPFLALGICVIKLLFQ